MENSNSKPLQEEQPRNNSGDKEKAAEEKREFLMQLLNFRSTFVQSRKSADPKYKPYTE
jgi:hypothetical protein